MAPGGICSVGGGPSAGEGGEGPPSPEPSRGGGVGGVATGGVAIGAPCCPVGCSGGGVGGGPVPWPRRASSYAALAAGSSRHALAVLNWSSNCCHAARLGPGRMLRICPLRQSAACEITSESPSNGLIPSSS